MMVMWSIGWSLLRILLGICLWSCKRNRSRIMIEIMNQNNMALAKHKRGVKVTMGDGEVPK